MQPTNCLRHIAIIMDGNGRWAKEKGYSRIRGHHEGAKAVRRIVTHAAKIGLEYLTLYSFSVENWKRSKTEIQALMTLLKRYLVSEKNILQKNNIRFMVIGRIQDLPQSVQDQIQATVSATSRNTGLTLILALSYGGRQEILDACQKVWQYYQKLNLPLEAISEEEFAKYLYTKDIPDPDLLIRTSGEMRVSNFLLWQISYAEICVTKKYWPDFMEEDLDISIREFSKRQRRYGGVPAEVK